LTGDAGHYSIENEVHESQQLLLHGFHSHSYGAQGPNLHSKKTVWKYSIKLGELRRSVVFLEITLRVAKYLQAYVYFEKTSLTLARSDRPQYKILTTSLTVLILVLDT